jgi:hypothetical protein
MSRQVRETIDGLRPWSKNLGFQETFRLRIDPWREEMQTQSPLWRPDSQRVYKPLR